MLRLTPVKQMDETTAMLGIRLEPELEARLEQLARHTGQTKSHHAREAIKRYLDAQRPERRTPEEKAAIMARVMEISKRFSALPVLSDATEDEILGYDELHGPLEPR